MTADFPTAPLASRYTERAAAPWKSLSLRLTHKNSDTPPAASCFDSYPDTTEPLLEPGAGNPHATAACRPVANAKRELVIGRRSHGYVALYRFVSEIDTVFVLAIRSQREAGYFDREPAG